MTFKKKVKTFVIHGIVSGSKYLGKIQASSKEEAVKKAWELESVDIRLCWSCTKECENPEITEMIAEEEDGR